MCTYYMSYIGSYLPREVISEIVNKSIRDRSFILYWDYHFNISFLSRKPIIPVC